MIDLFVTALLAAPSGGPQPTGACDDDSGVTVVVEPGSLGVARQVGCDPDPGGEVAAEVTVDAGFEVGYVAGQPFVCRIDGLPGARDEGCQRVPPDDAYWGLFWSDGSSGEWTYSTLGVAALEVPEGGIIGWRWQDAAGREAPTFSPTGQGAGSDADITGTDPEESADREDQDGWLVLVAGGSAVGLAAAAGAVAWRRRA